MTLHRAPCTIYINSQAFTNTFEAVTNKQFNSPSDAWRSVPDHFSWIIRPWLLCTLYNASLRWNVSWTIHPGEVTSPWVQFIMTPLSRDKLSQHLEIKQQKWHNWFLNQLRFHLSMSATYLFRKKPVLPFDIMQLFMTTVSGGLSVVAF